MHVYVAWMILNHQKKVKVSLSIYANIECNVLPLCDYHLPVGHNRQLLGLTSLSALLQLMQVDPHKLDFRSDLLTRLPGAGGLGPLGPMGGGLPPAHDLTRPPSLFSATGAGLIPLKWNSVFYKIAVFYSLLFQYFTFPHIINIVYLCYIS